MGLFKNEEMHPVHATMVKHKAPDTSSFCSSIFLFHFLSEGEEILTYRGKVNWEGYYYKVSLLCLVINIGHESSPFLASLLHFK